MAAIDRLLAAEYVGTDGRGIITRTSGANGNKVELDFRFCC
jgi:hypothetical protein